MATIQIKRGLQEGVDRLTLAQGELAVALDTGNLYIGAAAGKVHLNPPGGTADEAVKLKNSREFSLSGDATAPAVTFDGTQNVQLVLTLAAMAGLTAGTYTKLTVDAKGRVTGATAITVEDLPAIPSTKVTGLGTAAAKDAGTGAGNVVVLDSTGKIASALLPSLGYVPTSRTVNGKALSADLSLSAADVGAVSASQKGAAGGVAELDASGTVPAAQLPSYVDDVLEYDTLAGFPKTGEAGKIYVAADSNLTYRWSGTAYVEISKSLALGETSATAYRGDRGKAAYDHSQVTGSNPHGITLALLGGAAAADLSAHTGAANPHSGSEGLLKNAATKAAPVDADSVALVDSAASSATKRLTWASLKAALKTYFDSLYNKYTLPAATASVLGGVKVGDGLAVASGVLSVGDIDGGTF